MFLGSLPAEAIKVIANIVKEWECERIYIGCSGNFTIERCISNFYKGCITSNDVTIYSSALGKYFAGIPLEGDLEIREEYDGACNYFREYMKTDTERIATMILATEIVEYEEKPIAYFKRMLKAYEEQFKEMHIKMCAKLENIKISVDKFYYGDVMDMLDELTEEDGFISFPPFFKGGYEKMWKGIERVFTYVPPSYTEFDPKVHIEVFCHKVKAAKHFIVGTERKVEELAEFYTGTVLTKKGKPIYFYSRSERKVYVRPVQKNYFLKLERIGVDERVENVELCQLSHEQFEELRAVYLAKGIRTARESAAYGLFSNGKLFGCFAFSSSPTLVNSFDNMIATPVIYEMTDFAISPTCEKHLSKLVLYCVLSKEVKMLAEKLTGKRVRSVVTNAFSKNPISMKYRGLFEVLNRKVMEENEDKTPKKYNITYGAAAGQWTLQEGFEKWKRKS